MVAYRRLYRPGSTVFLTLVTYHRIPIFADAQTVAELRKAIAVMHAEMPFEFTAAVILPDHLHLLWTLPPNDWNYSKRVGRFKVLFTQALRGKKALPQDVSLSRRKHRESDVWQRRFWEHTIRDESDFVRHLDYLHYNPVKHGLVECPHEWQFSSFHRYVERGMYDRGWGCYEEGNVLDSLVVEGVGTGE
jgi:putative transposase